MHQLVLPFTKTVTPQRHRTYSDKLLSILSDDLNFQNGEGEHLSHRLHSFPAKFPPQLPRRFISELTQEGNVVLDPMMGSGTTILEAFLEGRQAIGFDIDPLALLLSRVKVQTFDKSELLSAGNAIMSRAHKNLHLYPDLLRNQIEKRYDEKSRQFIDYWFAPETQLELMALLAEIELIEKARIRDFFSLVFSSVIITKTGGVSLAIDLAHTRPHRVKVVVSRTGKTIMGEDVPNRDDPKVKFLTKILRSPLEEFDKRFRQSLRGVIDKPLSSPVPEIYCGNAQALPLASDSVDLLVTSPPYASNAIDYMRAHKFSLVWLGYSIDALSDKRKEYIGSEGANGVTLVELPRNVSQTVAEISQKSPAKGKSLQRYYSEMVFVLQEMFRVLKPGKAAIVVVGSSTLAGRDTRVQDCLADIGKNIGFDVPMIGVRQLDRDKRMMPAGTSINRLSQIQQRMHEEYVIGFYKPT
jgi:DNA modification methylase